MFRSQQQRVVIVTRPTWYQQLLARHGTRQQAEFFLKTRDQSLEPIEEQHHQFEVALQQVLTAIPVSWRRSRANREDLDRFLFEPDDIVVALGQDGLIANTAKYLEGQAVVGVNPHPDLHAGVLAPFSPQETAAVLEAVAADQCRFIERTMVEATLDDGQRLLALNEIYLGDRGHQSARYELKYLKCFETQSSSGVIVATGTGSSGWARSINGQRARALKLPEPTEPRLVFFTREAWPSATTGTSCTQGELTVGQELHITSRMNDGGVIFGDGIEADCLEFNWGRRVSIALARQKLRMAGRSLEKKS